MYVHVDAGVSHGKGGSYEPWKRRLLWAMKKDGSYEPMEKKMAKLYVPDQYKWYSWDGCYGYILNCYEHFIFMLNVFEIITWGMMF